MKKITVVGLGKLGLPLAEYLSEYFDVYGVARTPKLTKVPFLAQDISVHGVFSDVVVLTLPPSQINFERLPKIRTQWLIYTSSTSVYGDLQGLVTEEMLPTPSEESGKNLLKIEEWVKSFPNWTILRLGGLVGENRHPGNYLAGKIGIKNPEAPVNLIHHGDVIRAVGEILSLEKKNDIYNLVSDEHRSRKEFYQEFAKKNNLSQPEFEAETKANKLVSNEKIKSQLKMNQFIDVR